VAGREFHASAIENIDKKALLVPFFPTCNLHISHQVGRATGYRMLLRCALAKAGVRMWTTEWVH